MSKRESFTDKFSKDFIKRLDIKSKARKEFERQLSIINIPHLFREIVEESKNIKDRLLDEFTKTEKQPNFHSYLRSYYTEEEIVDGFFEIDGLIPDAENKGNYVQAEFISQTDFEIRVNELKNEFYQLSRANTLDEKYYNFLLDITPTIKLLNDLDKELFHLQDYVMIDENIDNYHSSGKTIANSISERIEKIQIYELKIKVLNKIISDNHNIKISVKRILDNCDKENLNKAEERYWLLKNVVNSTLKERYKDIDNVVEINKCTSKEFKKDISELCTRCPLKGLIENGIKNQIIAQAQEQKEILTDSQFKEYINKEIENAQNGMQRVFLTESQNKEYKNDPHRSNRVKIYIWNKERIKALNSLIVIQNNVKSNTQILNDYYDCIVNRRVFGYVINRENDLHYSKRIRDWKNYRNQQLLNNQLLKTRVGWLKPFNNSLANLMSKIVSQFKYIIEWKEQQTKLHHSELRIGLAHKLQPLKEMVTGFKINYDSNKYLAFEMQQYCLNGYDLMLLYVKNELLIDIKNVPNYSLIQDVIDEFKNAIDEEKVKLSLEYSKYNEPQPKKEEVSTDEKNSTQKKYLKDIFKNPNEYYDNVIDILIENTFITKNDDGTLSWNGCLAEASIESLKLLGTLGVVLKLKNYLKSNVNKKEIAEALTNTFTDFKVSAQYYGKIENSIINRNPNSKEADYYNSLHFIQSL